MTTKNSEIPHHEVGDPLDTFHLGIPYSFTVHEAKLLLREALEQHDWLRAVSVIGTHWAALLDDMGGLLDEALRIVPLNVLEQDAQAAAVRDIRLHSSTAVVDRVLGAVSDPDTADLGTLESLARSEQAPSLLRVASSRMIALRVRGRMNKAVQLADLVERFGRIAAVHQPDLALPKLPSTLLHAGITRGLADDIPGAVISLRDAYERGPTARATYVQRDAAAKSALFYALAGDISHARRWLQHHDESPPVTGWHRARIALTADIVKCLIETESLDQHAAEVALHRLDQPVNAEQGWAPAVTYALARHALAWGDRLGAVTLVRRDRQRYADWLGEGSTLGRLLEQAEVDLLLSVGRTRQAHQALTFGTTHPVSTVTHARIDLLAGRYDRAARRAASPGVESHSTRTRTDALAIRTIAHLQRSDFGAATPTYAHLNDAIRMSGFHFAALSFSRKARSALGQDLIGHDHGARDSFAVVAPKFRITRQQRLVLAGLERGLTLPQIADNAHLSLNTIKTHAKALYRRLGVTTRDEAVARAHEEGLL